MSIRVKSALIYGAIILSALFITAFCPMAFSVLTLFALYVFVGELQGLVSYRQPPASRCLWFVQGLSFLFPLCLYPGSVWQPVRAAWSSALCLRMILAFGLWQFSFFLVHIFYLWSRQTEDPLQTGVTYAALGLYLSAPLFSAQLMIYALPGGLVWLTLALITPWLVDSSAWYFGRKYGQRKIFPTLSPHKTYAGSVAALLAGSLGYGLIFLLARRFLDLPLSSLPGCLIFGGLASLVCQLGDLWESAMKRAAGVKDSGNFIPGHGGLLDRLDSTILLLPFYALLLTFLYSL